MSLRDHRDTFVLLKTSVVAEAIGLFLRGSKWPTRGLKISFDPLCLLAAGDHRPVLYYGGGGAASGSLVRKLQNAWFFSLVLFANYRLGDITQTDNIIAPKKCAPWGLLLTGNHVYIQKTGVYVLGDPLRIFYISLKNENKSNIPISVNEKIVYFCAHYLNFRIVCISRPRPHS